MDTCPCCLQSTETLNHMLSRQSDVISEHWLTHLENLESKLWNISTRPPITSAIIPGITKLVNQQADTKIV